MNEPVYSSIFKKEFQDLVDLKRALRIKQRLSLFVGLICFSLKTSSLINVLAKNYAISGAAKKAMNLSRIRQPASAQ